MWTSLKPSNWETGSNTYICTPKTTLAFTREQFK